MTQLGVRVPAGFTITTDACRAFMRTHDLPEGLEAEVDEHVGRLEAKTGKRFGSNDDPLLVSVRSGAAVSMPGMMDTILNLGLNDEAAEGLAVRTANPRFAFDSYRRLIQMYGEVVDGIDGQRFELALTELKAARGVQQDTDLTADDLRALVETFKRIYADETGGAFPTDARAQLLRAVRAVFRSWENPRAQVYRRVHEIPEEIGTAVNVVQMVFGNKGDRSGTGVAFTRDPSTGERGLYGEFLANAQGEDVVAGIRTPLPLQAMEEVMPAAFALFVETMGRLEEHYRDMQDIEFTVEDDELYLLQTRAAKRTAAAALKAAAEMAGEGLITRAEAVARIEPGSLDQLLHPMIDPKAELAVAAKGLNASPGAASGGIVFDADTAVERAESGRVILVRFETTPDDIHGMIAAEGILTVHGGMTSHAAVVARGMGKPCVAGCEGLEIDADAKTARLGGQMLGEGDVITIDGGTGRVFIGEVPLVPPQLNEDFETILGWADEIRRLRMRANADTPVDATRAREFGAEGIGLCRTEHMFFGEERLPVVQEMIMAESEEDRRSALDRLLPFQQADFEGIFEAMAGLPVTIRLLDPPLHEFLPAEEEATDERMRARIRSLQESNPMLGTRGCRLGLMFPGDLRDADPGDRAGRARGRGAHECGAARRGDAPARRVPRGAAPAARPHRVGLGGGGARRRAPDRHDDRGAQSCTPLGRDRSRGGLLLVRDERPDPDDARVLARRRRGEVPDPVPRGRRARAEPVRGARCRRGRRPDADRGRAGPGREAGDQARHLRRARRRPALDRLLRGAPPRLRQLLAVPGPAGAPRRGAGDARRGRLVTVRRRRRVAASASGVRNPIGPRGS